MEKTPVPEKSPTNFKGDAFSVSKQQFYFILERISSLPLIISHSPEELIMSLC